MKGKHNSETKTKMYVDTYLLSPNKKSGTKISYPGLRFVVVIPVILGFYF